MTISPASAPLSGSVSPPGDKSISHRALFFGALNQGITRINNLSPAVDCASTAAILAALGYTLRVSSDTHDCELHGGERAFHLRDLTLDCGNSGTTVRLAMGFLTGEVGHFTLTGDDSLLRRPMDRVAGPLARIGAEIRTTDGRLPVEIRGRGIIHGGSSHGVIAVGSAQVHAALMLAGLRSEGGVMLARTSSMRDHTLRMLRHLGVDVTLPVRPSGEERELAIDYIRPTTIDRDLTIDVPGDISSAAFFVAAALLVPGSRLSIENVGLNPTRIAFLHALVAMGASLSWEITHHAGGEPVGRIVAGYSSELRGITLDGAVSDSSISVADMMDELPLLVLVASRAVGETSVRGAAELRVKESDRIAATLAVLAALGIEAHELEDGFIVSGPQEIMGGAAIDHRGDHRLCMMAAVAALAARGPVEIPEPEVAAVSYPGFWEEIERIVS